MERAKKVPRRHDATGLARDLTFSFLFERGCVPTFLDWRSLIACSQVCRLTREALHKSELPLPLSKVALYGLAKKQPQRYAPDPRGPWRVTRASLPQDPEPSECTECLRTYGTDLTHVDLTNAKDEFLDYVSCLPSVRRLILGSRERLACVLDRLATALASAQRDELQGLEIMCLGPASRPEEEEEDESKASHQHEPDTLPFFPALRDLQLVDIGFDATGPWGSPVRPLDLTSLTRYVNWPELRTLSVTVAVNVNVQAGPGREVRVMCQDLRLPALTTFTCHGALRWWGKNLCNAIPWPTLRTLTLDWPRSLPAVNACKASRRFEALLEHFQCLTRLELSDARLSQATLRALPRTLQVIKFLDCNFTSPTLSNPQSNEEPPQPELPSWPELTELWVERSTFIRLDLTANPNLTAVRVTAGDCATALALRLPTSTLRRCELAYRHRAQSLVPVPKHMPERFVTEYELAGRRALRLLHEPCPRLTHLKVDSWPWAIELTPHHAPNLTKLTWRDYVLVTPPPGKHATSPTSSPRTFERLDRIAYEGNGGVVWEKLLSTMPNVTRVRVYGGRSLCGWYPQHAVMPRLTRASLNLVLAPLDSHGAWHSLTWLRGEVRPWPWTLSGECRATDIARWYSSEFPNLEHLEWPCRDAAWRLTEFASALALPELRSLRVCVRNLNGVGVKNLTPGSFPLCPKLATVTTALLP